MNFLDAVLSDAPFRRPQMAEGWYWWINDCGALVAGLYPAVAIEYADGVSPSIGYLNAEDWEVHHYHTCCDPIIISKKLFWEAIADIEKRTGMILLYKDMLARELGVD